MGKIDGNVVAENCETDIVNEIMFILKEGVEEASSEYTYESDREEIANQAFRYLITKWYKQENL
jgi:hypothetical protein